MATLTRIDPGRGETQSVTRRPDDPDGLPPGYVMGQMVDRDGRLWVGTGGGGLSRLSTDGVSFERFHHDPQDPATLSDDFVTSMDQTVDGKIWVGTRSGGLNALDPATGRTVRYHADPADPTSLSHHYVLSVLSDTRGRPSSGSFRVTCL